MVGADKQIVVPCRFSEVKSLLPDDPELSKSDGLSWHSLCYANLKKKEQLRVDFRFDSVEKVLATGDRTFVKAP